MICIIDYGSGNQTSIKNAIIRLGYKCIISNKAEEITQSEKFILPGVGAFEPAIKKIEKLKLNKILENEIFKKEKYILGICLGFQLMFSHSTEFKKTPGLKWIEGAVTPISKKNVRLPHNGWNRINVKMKNEIINANNKNTYFYFNHSLSVKSNDPGFKIIGTTLYGEEFISCGMKNKNIYGIQPHPEKSQLAGLEVLKNFLKL